MNFRPASPFKLAFFLCLVAISPAHSAFRSYDGTGNNLSNPQWGSAGQNFLRLDVPHYSDSISAPTHTSLFNPRDASNSIGGQSVSMPDAGNRSDYVWQWGQFLDHDITLTAGGGDEYFPIMVNAEDDPLYPMIPMMRSGFDPATGTDATNPRQQFNENTAYIDGSMIYGSDAKRATALRAFTGGRLATTAGGQMLPRNTGLLPNANDSGIEPDETLFLAGDVRSNEHLGLTAMHTLFVREHNRLADELAASNPTWNDEQIYQQARKITGAIVQNITFKEYLPALLGKAAPSLTGASYDPLVDPTLSNEFSTAAFRVGHTQVSPHLRRLDSSGNPVAGGSIPLEDAFFAPSMLSSPDEVDYLLHGLAAQVQQSTDVHVIDSLRNSLFGNPGDGGLDLLAINIQRSRDHGLGSFTQLQAALGMTPAASIADITSDVALQNALMSEYGSIDEIDLWIGLLSEDDMYGSVLGATMTRVVADQFQKLMTGDRFFYLWDDGLTAEELALVTNTRLSDVLLRNSAITSLQGNVFFVPEPTSWFAMFCACGMLVRRPR